MSCDINPDWETPARPIKGIPFYGVAHPNLTDSREYFANLKSLFFEQFPLQPFLPPLQSRNTPLKKSQPVFRIAFWFANHHQKQRSTHLSTPRHSVQSHLPRMWWQRPWPPRHKTQPMRSIPSRVLPTTR